MRPALLCCIAAISVAAVAASCGKDDKSTPSGDAGGTGKAVCTPVTAADFPAAQSPNDCTAKMYTTYGGAPTFKAVTAAIIKASLDPASAAFLGDSFQTQLANASDDRKAAFTQHLETFIEMVYSGGMVPYPTDYPTMQASHASLGITIAQYNAFLEKIVVPVLQTSGVSASDIDNCFAPPLVHPDTMKTVVTCK